MSPGIISMSLESTSTAPEVILSRTAAYLSINEPILSFIIHLFGGGGGGGGGSGFDTDEPGCFGVTPV